jgi:hypothetical protein
LDFCVWDLSAGVVSAATVDDWTPLLAAAYRGHLRVCVFLVRWS